MPDNPFEKYIKETADPYTEYLQNINLTDSATYSEDEKECLALKEQIDALNGDIDAYNMLDAEEKDLQARLALFDTTNMSEKDSRGYYLDGGMQVFHGIISNVSESYGDGHFSISLSCATNMRYLELSQFIFKPSITNTGAFFDQPIYWDKSGNKVRLRWKHGRWSAAGATETVKVSTNSLDYYHNANVIRWADAERLFGKATNPTHPFATLDSANIISVCTTGYSFDPVIYLSFSIPDQQNEMRRMVTPARSTSPFGNDYVGLIQDYLGGQSKAMGNLLPFAWVPADILAYNTSVFGNTLLSEQLTTASDLSKLPLKGQAVLEAPPKDNFWNATNITKRKLYYVNEASAYLTELEHLKDNLEAQKTGATLFTEKYKNITDFCKEDINGCLEKVNAEINRIKPYIITDYIKPLEVNAVVTNYGTPQSGSGGGAQDSALDCLEFSDAQKYLLTKKRKDIIRNIDQDFMVIDLTYSASIAIRAYNYKLLQLDIWQAEYMNPKQICQHAADQLDWEFFADSQGNLWYRRPQYNNIPLSVYRTRILPQILKFKNDKRVNGQSIRDYIDKTSVQEMEKVFTETLPGISPVWVLIYENPYLLAQILEVDAQIESKSYKSAFFSGVDGETAYTGFDIKNDNDQRTHYYISDKEIISWNLNEKNPNACRIAVTGAWPMDQDPGAGPFILQAMGCDFDLWYHYGFSGNSVHKEYLRTADQCLPYVQSYLALQYAHILDGTIQVIGNPYYQVGEVVYIESRDMLYYVSKVSHNFNYGGQYTTTLTLSYGHFPGMWLPMTFYVTAALALSGEEAVSDADLIQKKMTMGDLSMVGGPSDTPQYQGAMTTTEVTYDSEGKPVYKQLSRVYDPSVWDRLTLAVYYGKTQAHWLNPDAAVEGGESGWTLDIKGK